MGRKKDHDYFGMLAEGTAYACKAAELLHDNLKEFDPEKLPKHIEEMHKVEHAADIAKGIPGARDIDDRMAEARQKLDWDAQFECALDPETAKAIPDSTSV